MVNSDMVHGDGEPENAAMLGYVERSGLAVQPTHEDVEDDDEEEETCPGEDECDDPYCDERETFYVEVDRTVRYQIRAHNEDEALNLMWNTEVFSVNDPTPGSDGMIEEFEDDGDDPTIESSSERHAAEAQSRRFHAEYDARRLATEDAAGGRWEVSGLPDGVEFDPVAGTLEGLPIEGTPADGATFTVDVTWRANVAVQS